MAIRYLPYNWRFVRMQRGDWQIRGEWHYAYIWVHALHESVLVPAQGYTPPEPVFPTEDNLPSHEELLTVGGAGVWENYVLPVVPRPGDGPLGANVEWIMLRYHHPGAQPGDHRRGYELYGFLIGLNLPRHRPGGPSAMVSAGPLPLPPAIR